MTTTVLPCMDAASPQCSSRVLKAIPTLVKLGATAASARGVERTHEGTAHLGRLESHITARWKMDAPDQFSAKLAVRSNGAVLETRRGNANRGGR